MTVIICTVIQGLGKPDSCSTGAAMAMPEGIWIADIVQHTASTKSYKQDNEP